MTSNLEALKKHLGKIMDLKAANNLLSWDQQVNLPPESGEARAEQLSTLTSMAHSLFVSDETGELLEKAAPEVADLPYESDDAALVRVTRREYERQRRIPEELVAEKARAAATGFGAWVKAREASDFGQFQPHLEHILDLTIEYAEALGYEDQRYDALLDLYEPDMKTARVAEIFGELKEGLVPLVQKIEERGAAVDDSVLQKTYPDQDQWDFGLEILRDIGFDFDHGRQDRAAHPFTVGFAPEDVRITTRIYPDQLQSGLFGTIHEGGHALYEQGIRSEIGRTPLFDGVSYGVHESQSRLWENVVARSFEFWKHYFPALQERFPDQLEGVDLTTFHRAINKVEPSLIRVEADEVTYNLHIFVRFEIEQKLIAEEMEVADLPGVWNEKMNEYLGIVPDDDANGVLQDVHWSHGYFGYFPSYALGNLLSVQFYNQALKDLPNLPQQIENGGFDDLLHWLREEIHSHGKKFTPTELVERVTGGPMSAEPFLQYVREKYGAIYQL